MKCLVLIIGTVLISSSLRGQVITTFAGGGSCVGTFCGDGGPATAAKIGLPVCGSFDAAGNYSFWHDGGGPRVRKINTAGIITTIAGNGIQGFSGDGGPATNASLWLGFVISDSLGNLYLSSSYSSRIRRVDATTGIIQTICGDGTASNTGDGGPASAATIKPYGICFNKHGELLICVDGAIRKINSIGVISTIAGNGLGGFSGDGGPATAAGMSCNTICVDTSDNIFIGERYRIRKINVSSGIISTYGGSGPPGFYSGDGIPATSAGFGEDGIAIDQNSNLYIADNGNDRIRMIDPSGFIHTIAGTITAGFSGDGGPATAAQVYNPQGLAIDKCDNLYIADDANKRIRKIDFNPTCNPTLNVNTTARKEILLLPNPANDEVRVENVEPNSEYALYNIVGSIVRKGEFKYSRNTIDVKQLPSGLYMLYLNNHKGDGLVCKLVKE